MKNRARWTVGGDGGYPERRGWVILGLVARARWGGGGRFYYFAVPVKQAWQVCLFFLFYSVRPFSPDRVSAESRALAPWVIWDQSSDARKVLNLYLPRQLRLSHQLLAIVITTTLSDSSNRRKVSPDSLNSFFTSTTPNNHFSK